MTNTATEITSSTGADDSVVSSIAPSNPSVTTATSPATITFADFGLDPKIQKAVSEQGYTIPTPIQAQSIPHILAGRDLMGAAQTGTGKTAAFVLPIIQQILRHASNSASPARHPIRALVLTPTRELAVQVAENAANYSKHTDLR
ncbi:DEAD/DEAH box helicase, partial [Polynucleobacter sp.]|uniref:DEAD/DEAH box helicase n=1 Tax=Polynucleobacter sp. TaxID=2029855 RepID=UPI0030179956